MVCSNFHDDVPRSLFPIGHCTSFSEGEAAALPPLLFGILSNLSNDVFKAVLMSSHDGRSQSSSLNPGSNPPPGAWFLDLLFNIGMLTFAKRVLNELIVRRQ